ncbi:MAG: thiamine phosphate synthase [Lysobacter sp.]|nr:thiamine phosphate synthase [Lysobacter sp.]
MSARWPRRGLYLLTPEPLPDPTLLARLLPHAACLQYRAKQADAASRLRAAASLRAQCADAGVAFIVNDEIALAEAVSADGLHLGERDGTVADARARLGDAAIIGSSCYDDIVRAEAAARSGASYVAFGAFHPSPTKPHARRATPRLLRDAARLGLPRVAIGGITPDNAAPLVAAGADLIAVISGVFDASDPVAAARACATLFA